jgi:hypothetical protein
MRQLQVASMHCEADDVRRRQGYEAGSVRHDRRQAGGDESGKREESRSASQGIDEAGDQTDCKQQGSGRERHGVGQRGTGQQ